MKTPPGLQLRLFIARHRGVSYSFDGREGGVGPDGGEHLPPQRVVPVASLCLCLCLCSKMPTLRVHSGKYIIEWRDNTHWGTGNGAFSLSGFEPTDAGRLAAMAAYEAVVRVCGRPASAYTAELAACPEMVTELAALQM